VSADSGAEHSATELDALDDERLDDDEVVIEPATTPTETRRWRLLIGYNGASFRGFAANPGITTVAGALGAALERVTRTTDLMIVCAGRTDAGVHARGQVVHVDLPWPMPMVRTKEGQRPMEPAHLQRNLNRQLGPDIVVRSADLAPEGFDARRSATERFYRYLVWNAPAADPLLAPLAWHVAHPLDLRAMRSASDALIGTHDFRSFCKKAPDQTKDDPIMRRVTRAAWRVVDDPEAADAGVSGAGFPEALPGTLLRFEISAQSFCHQMVRALVGALVEVGKGEANTASLVGQLAAHTRYGAADPAPAHGLCLVKVSYD
jgi:tRNA pseudouridine38-40 synthase